jgi:hypothetical protein
MSRMDVLTEAELKALTSQSKLAAKYREVTDRESAYEILGQKIERAEAEAERQREREADSRSRPKTSTRRSTRQDPVIKVLTSATFIRGVLGILKKVMR